MGSRDSRVQCTEHEQSSSENAGTSHCAQLWSLIPQEACDRRGKALRRHSFPSSCFGPVDNRSVPSGVISVGRDSL